MRSLAIQFSLVATLAFGNVTDAASNNASKRLELRALVVDQQGAYCRIHDHVHRTTFGLKIGESGPGWTILSYDNDLHTVRIILNGEVVVLSPGAGRTPLGTQGGIDTASASTADAGSFIISPRATSVPMEHSMPPAQSTDLALGSVASEGLQASIIGSHSQTRAGFMPSTSATETTIPGQPMHTTATLRGESYPRSNTDPFSGMRRRPITDATLVRVADVVDPALVE